MRHLNVRIDEHIGASSLIKKEGKPKNSSGANHLTSCGDFSVLMGENKMFLLELKETLLIMRDQPYLNRNRPISTGLGNKIFVRVLLLMVVLLIVAMLFLLNGLFILLSISV